MADGRDLPPLPIPAPEAPVAESSRRHSHRSKYSIRDLSSLLALEQREHRETQRELSRVTELLRLETLRADEAARNVREATERLKSVNEARLTAVREAAMANESLGLYKFQLETAQNEIHRAQSVFDIVEKERYEAELRGAKTRTAARKLQERHKIHLAREEGRRMGLQEGLEAGRSGRRDTPLSNFGGSQFEFYEEFDGEEGLDSPVDSEALERLDSPSPPRNPPSVLPPTHNPQNTPDPVPVPPPVSPSVPQPVPVPAPQTGPATAPLSPLFTPFHDIHPIPVHNDPPHPRHEHVDIPPDGFIPETGPDSLPLVPPPHEFIRQREGTPRSRVSSVLEESVIAPSAFARAMSPRQRNDRGSPSQRAQSVRAESVRHAPSAAGSVRPVRMPTPRMNTDIAGIESQAQQRASWASDFYGGSPAPLTNSSGPIPITVVPPSQQESHASSVLSGTQSMGNSLFGPGATNGARGSPLPGIYNPGPGAAASHVAPAPGSAPHESRNGPTGTSPMPGSYALPSEGPAADAQYDTYDENESESTHSSDLQTSTPNTLTTPPESRRPHPHKPPRKKNPAAWPRDPSYERPPRQSTGPGFGYDGNVGSTSGT
ncbi:hypothetical protein DFH07DRAFT_947792 [Mycena maculata]|uniref:Uncharacterized protein n=1 Tax=Mycena maculata TaxID=230809 RepID=A0AAD7MFF1_9AGAR|nr:hypothetical protein DFH07DRAFT_947792 [Mycena maculata]